MIYFIDPVFQRELRIGDYSTKYEWRIFNNSYCNYKTYDHCFTNQTNKLNAEIELYKNMLDNYDGEEKIENKLIEAVRNTYRFERTYSELTQTNEIKIDSLTKYKDKIFRKIYLK